MPKQAMSSSEPTPLALAGFASPAFAIAALGLPLSAILPPLYAELGLSLTVVGTVFMLMRFFDGLTDPVFGVLGDRISTRWGRRRPAIVAAVPFLMIGVYLAFFPSNTPNAPELVISLLILYIGWTVFTIAHVAWASELTSNYDGRSRVMSYLQYFGLIGSVVVLLIPVGVGIWVPNATMADRAQMMGLLILCALPVVTAIALFSTPEKPPSNVSQPPWQEAWQIFRRSAALRRLLFADLLTGLQGGINGAVHFFFVIHVLLLPKSAALFLIAIFLTGVLCVPVFVRASYRFSKHRALCFGAIQSSFATAFLFVLPSNSFWLTLLLYIFIGINFGASAFLMRAMMADIVDEDHVAIGVERSALFYSILTLTPKLGSALAVGLVYPLLQWVGFDPTGVNSPETLAGVRFVVALAPTLVTASVVLIMWNYPLDRATQQSIRTKLDRMQPAN